MIWMGLMAENSILKLVDMRTLHQLNGNTRRCLQKIAHLPPTLRLSSTIDPHYTGTGTFLPGSGDRLVSSGHPSPYSSTLSSSSSSIVAVPTSIAAATGWYRLAAPPLLLHLIILLLLLHSSCTYLHGSSDRLVSSGRPAPCSSSSSLRTLRVLAKY